MSASERTFGGRYSVIGRAGTGGMAEVYRARDELLGREVAVKVLSERLSRDSAFVERFRREAQTAANLNHPNVVSLYDFGADDSTYYIVMEYIDGRALGDIIKSDGPLLPERAAEIAADVAAALERAHASDLVHRDIKPSNVMINSAGQTKVTDFGIARVLAGGEQTMTQTGMVIGTAAYLSPEQAQGEPLDQRSDVYSLGCVLFEMLTGRAPFSGETPLAVAYKHVREDPTPPSRVNPDVPSALDAIVMKALVKNPDNRYQSAGELREDLERFLGGEKVHATPLLAPTRVAPAAAAAREPYTRSKTALWVILTLIVLALLGLLTWLFADNLFGNPVTVPDLTDLTRSEAEEALENRGLEAEIVRRPDQEPAGEVIDQDPDAGTTIDEGDTVTLFVSTGPEEVTVPDVIGLTREEAEKDLEKRGLVVGDIEREFSDEEEAGRVIAQSIEPGERVEVETEIVLTLSKGEEIVEVPGVVGLTQTTAQAELDAAGLTFEVIEEPSSDVEAGVVFDQDPDEDTEVPPGTLVTLYVSTGPETFSMPNVVGRSASEAENELQDLGLEVNEVEEVCADQPPNHVCRTDPSAGEEVQEGDTVTIYVQPPGGATPGDD